MEELMTQAPGRYFIIRSRLNDYVMTLEKDNVQVMMSPYVKTKPAYQLWYEDHVTGTIRSKVNSFCLDTCGKTIRLESYKNGSNDQDVFINGQTIALRRNPQKVLDIIQKNKEDGATLCVWDYNGQHNQHWTIEYASPQYLTVGSMSTSELLTAGAECDNVIVQKGAAQPPRDAQLWYEDRFGVLRSKLNDLALDSSRGDVVLKRYDPSSKDQQFVVNGNTIINKHDHKLLLRIRPGQSSQGHIECGPARNHENERWMIKAV